MNKHELIESVKKSTPFIGSDEGWRHQHGGEWKEKRAEYISECNQRKQILLHKLESK